MSNSSAAHLATHKLKKDMEALTWVDIVDISHPANKPNYLQRIAFNESSQTVYTKWGDGAVIAYPNSGEQVYLRCIEEKSGKSLRRIKDYKIVVENETKRNGKGKK